MNVVTTIAAASPTAARADARHRAFHQKIADAAGRLSAPKPAGYRGPYEGRVLRAPAPNDPAIITDPSGIPAFPVIPELPAKPSLEALTAMRTELCTALSQVDAALDASVEATWGARGPYPTVAEIQKATAKRFNLSRTEFLSSRRTHDVVRPRQIAMYLAKELTTKSLPEIGRRFGGKDHTTVLAAVRRIKALMLTDARIAFDVAMLFQEITGIQQ